jgi:16S rRNA (guanine966-N2)-methyltransferase
MKTGKLRIIAGKFRGRKISTIEVEGTRPMTDRVRENLFNIINMDLPGVTFLDLFAGSGAVGIEALSRGAARSTFVEFQDDWSKTIKENIRELNIQDRTENLKGDAYALIREMAVKQKKFDIVFVGAPYTDDHHNRIMTLLIKHDILAEDGMIIQQYRASDPLKPLPPEYSIKTKTYGITSLSFIRKCDEQ